MCSHSRVQKCKASRRCASTMVPLTIAGAIDLVVVVQLQADAVEAAIGSLRMYHFQRASIRRLMTESRSLRRCDGRLSWWRIARLAQESEHRYMNGATICCFI